MLLTYGIIFSLLIGPPRWLFITHHSQAYYRLPVPVVDSIMFGHVFPGIVEVAHVGSP